MNITASLAVCFNSRVTIVKGCLVLMFFTITICKGQEKQVFAGFIPDQKVMKLAQQADKLNFPLFLESLNWINSKDTEKIYLYYYRDLLPKPSGTIRIKADPRLLSQTPIFRMNDYGITDYSVRFPVSWHDSVHPNPTWRLWFQFLVWLNPYLKSNNGDSLNVAYCIINDWITQHVTYPVAFEKSAFGDHAPAERLLILVSAYNKLEQLQFDDRSLYTNLLLSILSHIFFISSLEQYTCWHNHAIIFDEKLITSLTQLNSFKQRDEFLKLAYSRVFEQYHYSYTTEGVHKEHSPCYHCGFSAILNSLVASAIEFNIPVPMSIMTIKEKSSEYSRYAEFIGYNFPVGDCARIKPGNDQKRKNPLSRVNADTISSKVDSSKEQAKYGNLKYKLFPQSGWFYAFDSVSKVKITAQSDFFSMSHYQRDETSFIIKVRNLELIIDPGLYSYTNSPVTTYFRSSSAHNMLVVDDLPDDVDMENTGLSGITRSVLMNDKNGMNMAGIEMTNPNYRKYGVDVHRQFIFPGGHEMIVKDVVRSKDKHTYKQLFHLAPDAMVTQRGNTIVVKWGQHSNYLVLKSKFDSFRIITGQEDPMQGWYFPLFNEIRPAPVLELSKKGDDCDFKTSVYIVVDGTEKPKPNKTARNVRKVISQLELSERRNLVHLPFPKPWKPER